MKKKVIKIAIDLATLLVLASFCYFSFKTLKPLWQNYVKHRREQSTLEQMYFYRKYCFDTDGKENQNCEDVKQVLKLNQIDI